MGRSRSKRTAWIDRSSGDGSLHLPGGAVRRPLDWGYALHESELSMISATDLRHALSDSEDTSNAFVSDGSLEWVDDEGASHSGVEFYVLAGDLVIEVDVTVDDYIDEVDELQVTMTTLLGNLLTRYRAELVSVEHNGNYVGEAPYPTQIQIRPATRGRMLDEAYRLALDVAALVDASTGGQLSRRPTFDLLRAGQGAVLIGQLESGWLDVKTQLYDLHQLTGKVSLAQAVARFANSDGGIVIFGMGTRKIGSGEQISKLRPVPTDAHTVRRHRQALENHLYPVPVSLGVEIVAVPGGTLLVVHVPSQPDETKPFLVHGAIVEGKGEGAFISIVRRYGEDSIPITAPAVHAAMSMNRILDRITGPRNDVTISVPDG